MGRPASIKLSQGDYDYCAYGTPKFWQVAQSPAHVEACWLCHQRGFIAWQSKMLYACESLTALVWYRSLMLALQVQNHAKISYTLCHCPALQALQTYHADMACRQ